MKKKQLKLIVLFTFITAFYTTVMAQKQNFKEVKINETSEVINVSADSLWNIVRQFDNIGVFLSGIDHAVGTGEPEFEGATCSERTCYVNLKGYNEVHEKLTLFDQEKKELAYQFKSGGPGFLLFAENHWTVHKVGPNQSILKMNVTIRLKRFMGFLFGGKIKRTIQKELPISLTELKLYAETGKLSEAKKTRIAELERTH